MELKEFHKGQRPNKTIIEEFVNKTLSSGRVVPGYGHAVLRNTDPRFIHLKEFADRNIKDDYICDLAKVCFETVPLVLGKVGKIKNPYPNVDAYSGSLLQHYGNKLNNLRYGRERFLHLCICSIKSLGLPFKRYLVKSLWSTNRKTKQYQHQFLRKARQQPMIYINLFI